MRVSVGCRIYYTFEAEIDDTIDGEPVSAEDAVFLCDCEDPVYPQLSKILYENHLDYQGDIISVVDVNTDKEIWVE